MTSYQVSVFLICRELMFLQQKELFELVFGPHLVVLPITDNPETAQLIDNV